MHVCVCALLVVYAGLRNSDALYALLCDLCGFVRFMRFMRFCAFYAGLCGVIGFYASSWFIRFLFRIVAGHPPKY